MKPYIARALIRHQELNQDTMNMMLKNLITRATSAILQDSRLRPDDTIVFTAHTALRENPEHLGCYELQVEAGADIRAGQPPKDRYEFSPDVVARLQNRTLNFEARKKKEKEILSTSLDPKGDLL